MNEVLGEHGAKISSSRMQLIGWYLFDFANSVLIVNGGLYFPQWVVIEAGLSDFWYNASLVASTLLLIFSAPTLGLLSDKRLGRMFFLRVLSAAMFLAGLVLGIGGLAIKNNLLKGIVGLLMFVIIIYSYQLSLVFYNVMLGRLAARKRWISVSGIGLASGWIGGIVAILVILPFVQGTVPVLHSSGRVQAFLPSTLIYGLLTLLSLFLLRGYAEPATGNRSESLSEVYREFFHDIRGIIHQKRVWIFLLAYLIFSDAILTIQNNSPIYLEVVMGFSDGMKACLFLMLLGAAAVGGVLSGMFVQRYGLKKTLIWILAGWVVVLGCLSFTSSSSLFVALFALVGLFFGGIWNVSRVTFLVLVPSERRGEYFGIYSSYERFASILGPLIWSLPIMLLPFLGPVRYRISLLTMAVLILVSAVVLGRLDVDKNHGSPNTNGAAL
jgi:UMF1 family MFS transporter